MTKYLSAEHAKNDMRRTMDEVEKQIGLNKREADRDAEKASETANWDLGNIAINHPSKPLDINPVLIDQVRILGPMEQAQVIPIHAGNKPHGPQGPETPDHSVSHAG